MTEPELSRHIAKQVNKMFMPLECIDLPICAHCKWSKYPYFRNIPVICTALGNKETKEVFNSTECRTMFKNEKHPWKELYD
jgi:hypothetical protein